jgi:hypothetical protein
MILVGREVEVGWNLKDHGVTILSPVSGNTTAGVVFKLNKLTTLWTERQPSQTTFTSDVCSMFKLKSKSIIHP